MPFIESMGAAALDALGQRESVRPVSMDAKDDWSGPEAREAQFRAVWAVEYDRMVRSAMRTTRSLPDAEDLAMTAAMATWQDICDGKHWSRTKTAAAMHQKLRLDVVDWLRRRKPTTTLDVAESITEDNADVAHQRTMVHQRFRDWVESVCDETELRIVVIYCNPDGSNATSAATAEQTKNWSKPWTRQMVDALIRDVRKRLGIRFRAMWKCRLTTKGTLVGAGHVRHQSVLSILGDLEHLAGHPAKWCAADYRLWAGALCNVPRSQPVAHAPLPGTWRGHEWTMEHAGELFAAIEAQHADDGQ